MADAHGAVLVQQKDFYWDCFKQFFVLFNKGFAHRRSRIQLGRVHGCWQGLADRPLMREPGQRFGRRWETYPVH